MILVTCPCCNGEKILVAVDSIQPGGELVLECLHCDNGQVRADELEQELVENKFGQVTTPASLTRNEMKPAEKREHLRGLGIKDPADIEKIIGDVYPWLRKPTED